MAQTSKFVAQIQARTELCKLVCDDTLFASPPFMFALVAGQISIQQKLGLIPRLDICCFT